MKAKTAATMIQSRTVRFMAGASYPRGKRAVKEGIFVAVFVLE
jgi:hypothetical protein